MLSPNVDPPERQPERSRLVAVVGSIGYIAGVYVFLVAAFLTLGIAVAATLLLTGTMDALEEFLTGPGMLVVLAAEPALMGVGTVIAAAISFSLGWIPKRVVGIAVPTHRQLLVGAGSVLVLLVVASGLSLIAETAGVPASEHTLFEEDAAASYYLALMVISILLIGPVEELLFRGLIQNYMRPAFGSMGAIVTTSVLFAAIHILAYLTGPISTALVSLVVVFVLSLVLGAIYERYRNIVLVMLIHGVYNAVLFGFQLL
ncbi:CPBP family intramembrane metalloprotease [Salinadaptatus halalkaliphilus]|uniref:CPBP family intramembrane metalloprotease n=1 Tax=Salinadaptatus halalkaliphilus TaxID=2419781 RepID=A0A4S3TLY2_9EURY|nr:CPBP family intramembrane glutamic endopeptidase [Salinadaptatus halalkaliphilus]THE65189.1 CPBP family intramembrane metalloprotease [Salinadaptatus halalkaliphilus]